ncbi:hypothetical protein GQ53DRAFT_828109 [Thozetella sp. PMI_491]|nr:hypothetical protein GQ53DRAFT_828109 [Thozetella sp. PMI_491]
MEEEELVTVGGPWDIVWADELEVEIEQIDFASSCPTPFPCDGKSAAKYKELTSTDFVAPQAQGPANSATNPGKSKPEQGSLEYAEHFQNVKDQIKELTSQDPTLLADLIPEEALQALLKDPQPAGTSEHKWFIKDLVWANGKIKDAVDQIQALSEKVIGESAKVRNAIFARETKTVGVNISLCRQDCPYRTRLVDTYVVLVDTSYQLLPIERELKDLGQEIGRADQQIKMQEAGTATSGHQWLREPHMSTDVVLDQHRSEPNRPLSMLQAPLLSDWRIKERDMWWIQSLKLQERLEKCREEWRKRD